MVLRNNDRILVLEKVDPKSKDNGLIDPEVFEGKNNLHAVMDESTCLWTFKYERGTIPEPLRMKFTSFKHLKEHADIYFGKKNIKITKVVD